VENRGNQDGDAEPDHASAPAGACRTRQNHSGPYCRVVMNSAHAAQLATTSHPPRDNGDKNPCDRCDIHNPRRKNIAALHSISVSSGRA
jgi:hypothetical protein